MFTLDAAAGTITIDRLTIQPGLTVKQFTASNHSKSAQQYVKSPGYNCFSLVTTHDHAPYRVRLAFGDEHIRMVELRRVFRGEDALADQWESGRELERLVLHSEMLRKQLGAPHRHYSPADCVEYVYPWGRVFSDYDVREGLCRCWIGYPRRCRTGQLNFTLNDDTWKFLLALDGVPL